MYYRVDRTYVTDAAGEAGKQADPPHFVAGGSASSAAREFIVNQDRAMLLGTVTELTGDKAMAAGTREGRVFVVFVQRGAEAPPRY